MSSASKSKLSNCVPMPEEKDIILSTGFSSIEMSAQIARDLLALGNDTHSMSNRMSRVSSKNSVYLSDIEAAILRSTVPILINETEEITALGETGIWANRSETINWKGDNSICEYPLNEDNDPEVITKKGVQELEYVQELAIRYLRPPTPPVPGDIIITQEPNTLTAPAPPLVIRQQPPRPDTPEPIVIREAPPKPPLAIGRKLITISGKKLPPPPRKVVIERLAPIPSKPQSVVIERWLPYNDSIKRRVIFRAAPPNPVMVKPRNVIVQWEAPNVNIRQEVKYLGVVRANPADYVEKYGDSLKPSNDLPVIVNQIQTPEGIILAADHVAKKVHELEGDIQGLSLVDLDKEGLTEYRNQLKKLGIKYLGCKSFSSSSGLVRVASKNESANVSKETKLSSASASAAPAPVSSSQVLGTSVQTSAASDMSLSGLVAPPGSVMTESSVLISTSATTSSQYFSSMNQTSKSMSHEALNIIDNVFNQIDTNNDGNIEVKEAERIFLRLNSRLRRSYGEDEVRYFFEKLDTNMDGLIDLAEFRTAMLALI